ncbi:uncharacterized protein DSM5745_00239 [Aspergillus mulundensis]|uniref:beta-glucosidase n=1 Tax=Aspergillus mulundensis TaxID=1810919 RepID=A0A3D8T2Y4_9EURO|nr:hypothetical protein DSM5745_00239 [Aspergillus mulundensis]RDW92917.1 hypothetical protein DSM5745_00239 [Aspergillus mulundensis]
MKVFPLLSVLAAVGHASAGAVFAHFMVGNANNYTLADWQTDIRLAVEAKLDAFALNIAYGDDSIADSVSLAFQAAQGSGLSLFFSFDYAGGTGPWPKDVVISYGTQYFNNAAYYKYNGQPFVSTFEGPGQAADWTEIKLTTGCFFVPDWSSLGAKAALEAGGGDVVDGLFNWAAWPWGTRSIDTYTDGSYYNYMDKNISSPDPGTGLPYMMAVSPWFYTNLPGYNKNWCWKGDDLWYERWMEVIYTLPEFVEIISWNDYGESHYIGPLYEYAYEAPMGIGKAPINYVQGMPHDGWRKFLPWVIESYKNGMPSITQEGLVGWYRTSPGQSCGTGDTTGNTASQLQVEFEPYEVMEDKIFYTALLASDATVTVSIGGAAQTGSWTWTPDGGIGLYHGSVPFNGVGDVVITLSRGGAVIAEISGGPAISNTCTTGLSNWNAWVGEADGPSMAAATPALTRSEQACIQGTGVNNFAGICQYSCQYGYCPISACVCQAVGAPVAGPSATSPVGYPIAGEDASYSGVCAFDCERGYCPDTACSTVSAPLSTPTVSDFTPPACVRGHVLSTVTDGLKGLCDFACGRGFCPIRACECDAQGALVDSSSLYVDVTATPIDGLEDWGLCAWSCQHGYCPSEVCNNGTTSGGSGDGSGSGSGTGGDTGIVYVDPGVWLEPSPTVGCEPPCTLLLPPISLATPVTVTWPAYDIGIYSSSGSRTITVTTIITLDPFTVSEVPFWPVTIGTADGSTGIITPVQSIMPPAASISLAPDQATISVGIAPRDPAETATTRNYTGGAPGIPVVPLGVTAGAGSLVVAGGDAAFWAVRGPFGAMMAVGRPAVAALDLAAWTAATTATDGGDDGSDGGDDGSDGGDDGSDGGDDGDESCEATKTVTSCGVLCTATAAFTTTYTGECSTTSCATTSCGVDTTVTKTTTTTIENFATLTAEATDYIWTPDTTDAFATTVWLDWLSWSSAEDAAASATATATATPTPTRGVQIWWYLDEHETDNNRWLLYEYSGKSGSNTKRCPELYPPDFSMRGTGPQMNSEISGFEAYGATCTYEPTTGTDAVGKFVCTGLDDALCYTTSGYGGTCAEGWLSTEEVRDYLRGLATRCPSGNKQENGTWGDWNIHRLGCLRRVPVLEKLRSPPLFHFRHDLRSASSKYSRPFVSRVLWLDGKNPNSSEATVEIRTTGGRGGHEEVQLYIQDVECVAARPGEELEAFNSVWILRGETAVVRLTLDKDAVSYWDETDAWLAKKAKFSGLSLRYWPQRKRAGYTVFPAKLAMF